MDQSAFDIFFTIKNYLYLGDYNKCLEEIANMDIMHKFCFVIK